MFDREYIFSGKHADYVLQLVDLKIFDRNIDVLIIAPIIGYYYCVTSPKDKSNSSITKIFTDQLLNEQPRLNYIFNMLTLLDNDAKKTQIDENIRLSFDLSKIDYDNELFNKFNSYVLGGVEKLYENLVNNNSKTDREIVDSLYEFLKKFEKDTEKFSDEHIAIDEVIKKYAK